MATLSRHDYKARAGQQSNDNNILILMVSTIYNKPQALREESSHYVAQAKRKVENAFDSESYILPKSFTAFRKAGENQKQ